MILANENAIQSNGYVINNSLRFQRASSQYLSRTFSSSVNQTTSTLSLWVKRGTLGTQQTIMSVAGGGSNEADLFFDGGDTITLSSWNGSTRPLGTITTSAVFRDPSAWYHIVFVVNTTTATANDRLILYVNGIRQALSVNTQPAQNATWYWNGAYAHRLGAYSNTLGAYMDGYNAEVNFIDGQALTPSSFGQTDSATGQWVAKKYTSTYGTNGFYLPFSNGTSTTTLGADSSGNANNWTLTNFTRSAGVSDCFMFDVPSGNGSGSGTQPSSNYAVLNPILENAWWASPSRGAISAGNLRLAQNNGSAFSSFDVSTSGKWYCEFTITSYGQTTAASSVIVSAKARSTFEVTYMANANKVINGTTTAYGTTWGTGSIIGVAIDVVNNQITFYKNNVSQGVITNSFPSQTVLAGYYCESTGSDTVDANFGNRSFTYTPPTGFKALCTANLPTATITQGNKYMDATLYTGNGTTQTVTNTGAFQPDLVWIKMRSIAGFDNVLQDSVRGAGKALFSDLTNAESTTIGFTSFNSNGFTLSGTTADISQNASTFVGWQWKAGNGTSSNTNGTITSTTSVGATQGFSVVTYTGTGANATVGHGLGVAPSWIIVKSRSGGGSNYTWGVYHAATGATKYLELNTTAAVATASTPWNNTAPTSSVFNIGTWTSVNTNTQTYVAYCFAEIAGFSKFGSYVANGSADGIFVYTGFRPRWIMFKRTTTATNWYVVDTAIEAYNAGTTGLYPNTTSAESTEGALDILSNGFKCRAASGAFNFPTGETFIYAAFAESPFASSNAR